MKFLFTKQCDSVHANSCNETNAEMTKQNSHSAKIQLQLRKRVVWLTGRTHYDVEVQQHKHTIDENEIMMPRYVVKTVSSPND